MFLVAATRGSIDGVTRSMAITAFGVLWIGLPFAHAVLLRELPLHGGALLIDVLVATFVADTSAYAVGRLVGRHKLAPDISPNKTIEGMIGGFIGGTAGFWFAGLYQDWLPGLDALLMGDVIAILAPMGDLFESMIKRDLGVKDSGNVFGPHGGLLDRLDAVLFTVVAGYYLSIAFVYYARASASRTNSRSAGWPAPGVSTITGASQARIMCADVVGVHLALAEVGVAVGAGARGSRESLAWQRSMRPVIARMRSTTSERSSPAACAWQVSKQKPSATPWSTPVTASQSFASASSSAGDRVVAAGGVLQVDGNVALEHLQRARPALDALVDRRPRHGPGWTISAIAPSSAAASHCWLRIFREP